MLYLEVNPVVEELGGLFLRSCSFSQSVIPTVRILTIDKSLWPEEMVLYLAN